MCTAQSRELSSLDSQRALTRTSSTLNFLIAFLCPGAIHSSRSQPPAPKAPSKIASLALIHDSSELHWLAALVHPVWSVLGLERHTHPSHVPRHCTLSRWLSSATGSLGVFPIAILPGHHPRSSVGQTLFFLMEASAIARHLQCPLSHLKK